MTSRGPSLRILAFPAGIGADENPYIRQLYEHMRQQGAVVAPLTRRDLLARRCDVVHVHWPEVLVSWDRSTPGVAWEIVKVLGGLWWVRRRGARLVWTGHNLEWHEMTRPRLYRWYLSVFVAMVDLLIALSDASREQLCHRYPRLRRARAVTIPHGHYRDAYPPPPTRDAARSLLGLPRGGAVYLVMGQIRRYKNVVGLIRAFRETDGTDRLLVAGSTRGDDELTRELQDAAGHDERVVLRLGYVPDDEVPVLHAAADVVVLPYESPSLLNSGAAILALSLQRPVVMRSTPSTAELSAQAGPGWISGCDGPSSAALLMAAEVAASPPRQPPVLADLEWEPIAAATLAAMTAVVSAGQAR